MTEINPAAEAARENSRQAGKFGEQKGINPPEETLPASPRAFAWFDGSGDYSASVSTTAEGIDVTLDYVTGEETWQYRGRRWEAGDEQYSPDFILSEGFAFTSDIEAENADSVAFIDGDAYLLEDISGT